MATFEKAFTQNEHLSSLHQAVVEVVTLRDSATVTADDLSRVTYTSEVLAAISSTTIALGETSERITLKYQKDGKQTILEALSVTEKVELYSLVDNKGKSNDSIGRGYNDNINDRPPQKRTPYSVTSQDFLWLPVPSLELLFPVSHHSPISLATLIQRLLDH